MPGDRAEAAADLRRLLDEWRLRDEKAGHDALTEEEAIQIANEELDAFREERA